MVAVRMVAAGGSHTGGDHLTSSSVFRVERHGKSPEKETKGFAATQVCAIGNAVPGIGASAQVHFSSCSWSGDVRTSSSSTCFWAKSLGQGGNRCWPWEIRHQPTIEYTALLTGSGGWHCMEWLSPKHTPRRSWPSCWWGKSMFLRMFEP